MAHDASVSVSVFPPIFVNYDQALHRMMPAGKCNLQNMRIRSSEYSHLRIQREGKKEIIPHLIQFGKGNTFFDDMDRALANLSRDTKLNFWDDVVSKFASFGLRPAIIHELLTFGEIHPEEQLKSQIIAFGSVTEGHDGILLPVLESFGPKRRLNLLRVGAVISNTHSRFLAVCDK